MKSKLRLIGIAIFMIILLGSSFTVVYLDYQKYLDKKEDIKTYKEKSKEYDDLVSEQDRLNIDIQLYKNKKEDIDNYNKNMKELEIDMNDVNKQISDYEKLILKYKTDIEKQENKNSELEKFLNEE